MNFEEKWFYGILFLIGMVMLTIINFKNGWNISGWFN
jgi:hypothetical protein